MPSLLAWALALAATVLFAPALADKLLPSAAIAACDEPRCTAIYLAATIIFGIVSLLTGWITIPLCRLLSTMGHGPLGSICGSAITLLRWLTMMSWVLNLWCSYDPYSTPMRLADAGDGGIVEGVMWIAPALSGYPDFHEMVHRRQLREARFISLNFNAHTRVLLAGHSCELCPSPLSDDCKPKAPHSRHI